MNYRPYTKEDKLEVGTKIRLGGREGEIVQIDNEDTSRGKEMDWLVHLVRWDEAANPEWLNLDFFNVYEIEDIPLPPLTIDKRVKEELMCMINDRASDWVDLEDYLNSLEEV